MAKMSNSKISEEWVSKISKNLFPGEGGQHNKMRYLGYVFYSQGNPIAQWTNGMFKVLSKPESEIARKNAESIKVAIKNAGFKVHSTNKLD